jgi:hypothetical protein
MLRRIISQAISNDEPSALKRRLKAAHEGTKAQGDVMAARWHTHLEVNGTEARDQGCCLIVGVHPAGKADDTSNA